MKFSICMSAFNASNTIGYSINSVLNQTFKDYELIVVDDGSTDTTFEIVNSFASQEPRIKLFSNGKLGLLKARLLSIEMATGEYVIFLDSDDLLKIDALEQISFCAEKHSSPDLIHYCAFVENKNGKIKSFKRINQPIECDNKDISRHLFESLLLTGKYTTLWNKAVKRECFALDYLKTIDNIFIGEDNLLLLFAANNIHTYAFLNKYLYTYRANNGITKEFRKDCLRNLQIRFEAGQNALRIAKFNINSFITQLETKQVIDVSKIIAYQPNKVIDKADYFAVLQCVYNDESFWTRFYSNNNNIPFLYKLPLRMIKKKHFKLLLSYKNICSFLRGVR